MRVRFKKLMKERFLNRIGVVTPHSGILIMPDEDHEYYEVGYTDLLYGDIDAILDALPEE